jgi:hypothetical protein
VTDSQLQNCVCIHLCAGGWCIAPDTCACPPQWTGYDCDLPVCSQGFFVPEPPSSYPEDSVKYQPCNMTDWCDATNGFDCAQRERWYARAPVEWGGADRSVTGWKVGVCVCRSVAVAVAARLLQCLICSRCVRVNTVTFDMKNAVFVCVASGAQSAC